MKRIIQTLQVAILFAVIATPATTFAATPPVNQDNGLRISPVRTDITIEPGKSTTVNVTVLNVTGSPAALNGVVNDFIANSDETGNPFPLLDQDQYAASHSLKRYVSPIAGFTLPANSSKVVPVTITVPKNAAAGGYYGLVRFAPASSAASNTVVLTGSVGSLILLRVPGDINESLSTASFDVRKENTARKLFTSPRDLTAVMRFRNQGNIQVEPFGKLTLKDFHGKTLYSTEINNTDPRGNVLPDSIRRFDVPLKNVGSFGKYTLEGNFGYGTTGQLLTAKTTFYVIPLPLLIAIAVLVLLIVLAIIFVPRGIKAYNRRILRKARYRD